MELKKTSVLWKEGDVSMFSETLFVCELPPVGRKIRFNTLDYEVSAVRELFDETHEVSGLHVTEVYVRPSNAPRFAAHEFVTLQVRKRKSPNAFSKTVKVSDIESVEDGLIYFKNEGPLRLLNEDELKKLNIIN